MEKRTCLAERLIVPALILTIYCLMMDLVQLNIKAWNQSLVVTDVETSLSGKQIAMQIVSIVDDFHKKGFDLMKNTDGDIPEIIEMIQKEMRKLGLPHWTEDEIAAAKLFIEQRDGVIFVYNPPSS